MPQVQKNPSRCLSLDRVKYVPWTDTLLTSEGCATGSSASGESPCHAAPAACKLETCSTLHAPEVPEDSLCLSPEESIPTCSPPLPLHELMAALDVRAARRRTLQEQVQGRSLTPTTPLHSTSHDPEGLSHQRQLSKMPPLPGNAPAAQDNHFGSISVLWHEEAATTSGTQEHSHDACASTTFVCNKDTTSDVDYCTILPLCRPLHQTECSEGIRPPTPLPQSCSRVVDFYGAARELKVTHGASPAAGMPGVSGPVNTKMLRGDRIARAEHGSVSSASMAPGLVWALPNRLRPHVQQQDWSGLAAMPSMPPHSRSPQSASIVIAGLQQPVNGNIFRPTSLAHPGSVSIRHANPLPPLAEMPDRTRSVVSGASANQIPGSKLLASDMRTAKHWAQGLRHPKVAGPGQSVWPSKRELVPRCMLDAAARNLPTAMCCQASEQQEAAPWNLFRHQTRHSECGTLPSALYVRRRAISISGA